jgi:hypothetical protein
MEEPSKEEYDQMKRECQKLLVPEGFKASMVYGSLFLGTMLAVAKFTSFGRRITFQPIAILGTAGYVAPFWIVGEQSVLFCQRNAFDKRKQLVGQRFDKERFNRD